MNILEKVAQSADSSVVLLRTTGFLDVHHTDEFRERLRETIHASAPQIILGLDYGLDSSGIGAIITGLKMTGEMGRNLKIFIPPQNSKARMAFEITRAYKLFTLYGSIEETMAAHPQLPASQIRAAYPLAA